MWGERRHVRSAPPRWARLGSTLALTLGCAGAVGLAGCSAPAGQGPPATASLPVGSPPTTSAVPDGGTVEAHAPAWVAAALPTAVWGLPGVRVERGATAMARPGGPDGDVVVVGTVSRQVSAQLGDIGREAVRVARRAWQPSWDGRLLVVAPVDRRQWAVVAGPAAQSVGPAMTVSGREGPAYVVLDPLAWESATIDGRRALVIHEAVHVAVAAGGGRDASRAKDTTRPGQPGSAPPESLSAGPSGASGPSGSSRSGASGASGAPGASGASPSSGAMSPGPGPTAAPPASVPLWLSEGFAQLVAYDAVGAETPLIAGDLLKQVRRDGPPARLPDDEAFAAEPTRRLEAYAEAWLACRTLERLGGASAPRRALAGGGPQAVGIDVSVLTAAWRADLRRWAATTTDARGAG